LTRYLLDTNVISDATKPLPSGSLLRWLAGQADGDLFISTLSIAEIWRGILQMPRGKRRRALEEWFDSAEGPKSLFAGRVLPFDIDAALIWARLLAEGTTLGRPRSAFDTMIAAIALAGNCVVVTANEKHFEAIVEFVNPARS